VFGASIAIRRRRRRRRRRDAVSLLVLVIYTVQSAKKEEHTHRDDDDDDDDDDVFSNRIGNRIVARRLPKKSNAFSPSFVDLTRRKRKQPPLFSHLMSSRKKISLFE
jgi:hypothetical protein